MLGDKLSYLFKNYFEITVFSVGLALLAFMNPNAITGQSLCLLNRLGIEFCPGEGLGHAIAFIFDGEFYKSFNANILGGPAIIILVARICYLLHRRLIAKIQ